MLNAIDSVLTSSDLSIDKVLQTGLPQILIFYDNMLSGNMRESLDELARQYAGKVYIVLLERKEASQAAKRFNVRQFPTLVAVKDGRAAAHKDFVNAQDARAFTAYLLGQGPLPASNQSSPEAGRQQAPASQSSGPIKVDSASFDEEVLHSKKAVLVDFWAAWCGPCRMMEPALEKLSREHGDRLKIVKLNVDENPDIAGRYNVYGIPTMIVIENGKEADRLVGALPEGALHNRLGRWIGTVR